MAGQFFERGARARADKSGAPSLNKTGTETEHACRFAASTAAAAAASPNVAR